VEEHDGSGWLIAFAALATGFILTTIGTLGGSHHPHSLTPKVSGIPSPVCWPGGKRYLRKELLKRVPPHRVYVEPFAGAAWLFFAKKPAEVNVLNDVNRDLMTFYRRLRETDRLECDMKPDRERFERIRSKPDKSVCDFLYLNKNSYSCTMDSYKETSMAQNRCREKGQWTNCQIERLAANIEKVKSHLSKAILHNTDFREVLARYDGPDTFFYLDPPYWEPNRKECLYEEHCQVTPEEVAEAVQNLQGKVLISYDVHPRVEKAFNQLLGWKKELVETSYVMAIGGGGRTEAKKKKEYLIRNYD